jgi:transglutaminase-like putative cysteine protease
MDIIGENAVTLIGPDPVTLSITATLDYYVPQPADILLSVEAAQMADQVLIEDKLTIDGVGPLTPIAGTDAVGRHTWMHASGRFHAQYTAKVIVSRHIADIATLSISPVTSLHAEVIPYLWPSRYCESDRLANFVERQFGHHLGGGKVAAMADWIFANIEYRAGSSQSKTTAVDTFISRQGVCRDFAHLMASFARAADIPARVVSAYALGVKPPDFHAVVEIWLDGAWHLIDATRLASPKNMVRMVAGRDATDIAFMTIFGSADYIAQNIQVEQIA